MDMTPELLRDACKKNGGYAQPTLNDQLFLQCRGFNKIANLEPYVNLKVLWLEQNGIANIEGLEGQSKLVSLFLQNNAINQMVGLQSLSNLRILNLSHNYITRIEGLGASCPLLETLQISHNHLASLHACEDLWQLADTLSSVDLSFNKLERDDNAAPTNQAGTHDLTIVNFFKRLPNASVIYLQGNPLSHGLKNYRKNMIVHLPQLTYLDERPVFPDERRATEAWGVGGEKAEADERVKIRQEKKEELSSCVQTMARAMEANRETRDRLTKQWDEKRELEREELKVRRSAFKKQVQTLDSEEYEVRGAVEVQEDDAWEDLRYDMDRLYDALMVTEHKYQKAAKEAAELDRIKQQVESELKEQEEQIAELLERAAAIAPPVVPPVAIAAAALEVDKEVIELPAGKAARHVDPTAGSLNAASSAAVAAASSRIAAAKAQDSLNYWIKQLDQNDDEVLAQMEEDLQGFLLELEPGLPIVRSATTTTTAPSNTNNQSGKPKQLSAALLPVASNKQLHKMQRAVTEAVAVTAASLREGEAAVTGGVKKSREALWESFYAWETRNGSRTAK